MLDWIASNAHACVSYDYSKANCEFKPYNPYKENLVKSLYNNPYIFLIVLNNRTFIYHFTLRIF